MRITRSAGNTILNSFRFKIVFLIPLIVFTAIISCSTFKLIQNEEKKDGTGFLYGYRQFTIFKGINLIGYVADDSDDELFTEEIWTGKYTESKVNQSLELHYTSENILKAKVNLGSFLKPGAEFESFKEIKIKLINPKEVTLINPIVRSSAKKKKYLWKKDYIVSLLRADSITIEVTDRKGRQISAAADLKVYGIEFAEESKTSEKTNILAKDVYIGYKLLTPPEKPEIQDETNKQLNVLVLPPKTDASSVEIEREREISGSFLYETSKALQGVPNINVIIRDRTQVAEENKLKNDSDIMNIQYEQDIAKIMNANAVFTGKIGKFGNNTTITGSLKDPEDQKVLAPIQLELKNSKDKNAIIDFSENWRMKIKESFLYAEGKKLTGNTKSAESYSSYIKGLGKYLMGDEKNLKEAIELFKKSIEKDPKFSDAHSLLCESTAKYIHIKYITQSSLTEDEILEKNELEESAKISVSKAMEINPESFLVHRAYAQFYFTGSLWNENPDFAEHRKKALSYAEKAFKLNPKDAASAWLIFFIKAEDDKTILENKDNEDYKTAHSLNPNLFESILGLARINSRRENRTQAIEMYENALSRSPDHIEALFELAAEYRATGNFDKSEEIIKRVEYIYPNDWRVDFEYFNHYKKKGEFTGAESYLLKILNNKTKEFIEVADRVPSFYVNDFRNPERGIAILRSAILLDSKNKLSYQYHIAALYYRSQQYDQAVKILEQSLLDDSDRKQLLLPHIYNNLGLNYFKSGNREKAMEAHLKALAIRKDSLPEDHFDFVETYNNLALLFIENKKYQEALDYYNKSLTIVLKKKGKNHISRGIIHSSMGFIYNRLEEPETALTYLMSGLKIIENRFGRNHPLTEEVYFKIGTSYLKKKDNRTALTNYLIALGIDIFLKKEEDIKYVFKRILSICPQKIDLLHLIDLLEEKSIEDRVNFSVYDSKIDEIFSLLAEKKLEEKEPNTKKAPLFLFSADNYQKILSGYSRPSIREKINIGLVHEEQNEIELALAYYKKSLKENSNNPSLLYFVASRYAMIGESNFTKIYLEKAIASDPANSEFSFTLGRYFIHQNKPEEARDIFEDLILSPDNISKARGYQGIAELAKINNQTEKETYYRKKACENGLKESCIQ